MTEAPPIASDHVPLIERPRGARHDRSRALTRYIDADAITGKPARMVTSSATLDKVIL